MYALRRSGTGKSSSSNSRIRAVRDYRAGWFLLDDDTIELDDPMGWEPLTHEIDRAYFGRETGTAHSVWYCAFRKGYG
jgi:hypothetical protein